MKRGFDEYDDPTKRGRYDVYGGQNYSLAESTAAAVAAANGQGYGYDQSYGYGAGAPGGSWVQYGGMQQHAAPGYPVAPSYDGSMYGYQREVVAPSSHQPNRTVYFGGLAPETTMEEICNTVQGGALEQIKLLAEKNCAFVSFIDASCAAAFYQLSSYSPPFIHGRTIKVGWGKPNNIPSDVLHAVQSGATRSLCISNIGGAVDRNTLLEDLKRFGIIESVEMSAGGGVALVHFSSVKAAMQAAAALPGEEFWGKFKYTFSVDRCGGSGGTTHNPERAVQSSAREVASQSWSSGPAGSSQPHHFRTVYLGNLPRTVTADVLFDTIRGGLIDEMRLMVDKCCAFVTFANAESAQSFFADAQSNRIVVGGREVKVGWGKPSAPSNEIAEALPAGATRVMYLGGIDASVTDEHLRHNFSKYGLIESTRLLAGKNAAFINFMSISACLKALMACVLDPMSENYTLGFGKDRCAQPPATAGLPDTTMTFSPYTLHTPAYALKNGPPGDPQVPTVEIAPEPALESVAPPPITEEAQPEAKNEFEQVEAIELLNGGGEA